MNNPILACQGLGKKYSDGTANIEVLRQIDLEVAASELIAIMGVSGSGKSTLLHLLGGLDKPTSGHVTLAGKNLQHVTEIEKCELRNRHLGFVYQFHHLLPEFTALENTGMPLLIRGEKPAMIREKAAHLLEQVGLEKRMYHRLSQLSGGERQRVAIARALVSDPLCVLADEPTGNLDPHNADRVLELFINLQQKHHTSVVMVTHDPNIAKRAQRMLKIEEGVLVAVS
ncbi:MAG: lipoprotein releasing system, ATP-binding protein [Gammaproteobacteria bacterium RIFCSPHIGHO2_12_FULL_43_28]|nr:MAG: lipoprotein releasing system, ATP-binding protein [Gammaproteobacteria bacterium RIFCSPHIGHO2_12_FULL_43_28]